MKLSQHASAQIIPIKAPKWSTREVLIATYKVGEHNIISFDKVKQFPDQYYLAGQTIRKYGTVSNGKIKCFTVPLDEMQLFEGRE